MTQVITQHDPRPGPLTRAEFDELTRRGALDDARVELLYGRIVSMSPQGGPHSFGVTELARVLVPAVGGRGRVRVQMPLAVSEASEPEPDIAVVPPGDYLDEHPATAWLVVEVAESSLDRDRGKASLYAAAGVAAYWIVNLVEGSFEVYSDPAVGGYRTRHPPFLREANPSFGARARYRGSRQRRVATCRGAEAARPARASK